MKKTMIILACMLGTLTVVFAETTEIQLYSSSEFNKPEVRKIWNDFYIHHLKVMPSENTLKFEITGKDPYINAPKSAGGFSADIFKFIAVKMKCSHTAKTYNEVFWTSPEQRNWHRKKSIAFPVKEKADEFKVYNFNMAKNSLWTGIIENFRLDLFNGAPNGSIVEIEWIKISSQPVK